MWFKKTAALGALRPAGATALRQAYRALTSMARGLEERLETK